METYTTMKADLTRQILEVEDVNITFDELAKMYGAKDGIVHLVQRTYEEEQGATEEQVALPFTIGQLAIEIADGFLSFPNDRDLYLKEFFKRAGNCA